MICRNLGEKTGKSRRVCTLANYQKLVKSSSTFPYLHLEQKKVGRGPSSSSSSSFSSSSSSSSPRNFVDLIPRLSSSPLLQGKRRRGREKKNLAGQKTVFPPYFGKCSILYFKGIVFMYFLFFFWKKIAVTFEGNLRCQEA